jgi:hypothetical protein
MKKLAETVRNSPVMIRKKIAGQHHGYSVAAQHEKLEDDWLHGPVENDAGVVFYVKYLGMSPVQRSHGLGSTDEAVKRIVAFAKGHSSKLQKVALTVSSKSVRLVDVTTEMKLDELPLYRVSYCAVDPNYNKVCCYISKNPETSLLECHAFLCDNKSKAEAVTLTVAQAFNVAYQRWQEIKKKKKEAAKAKRDQELKEKSKSPVLGMCVPCTITCQQAHTNTHTSTYQHTCISTHQHSYKHTPTHIRISTHQHTYKHTLICMQAHSNMHTSTLQHACKHTPTHIQAHTNMHASTHQHTYKHTSTLIQTHTNTFTSIYQYAYINHTYTHAHTHTSMYQHAYMHT